METKLLLALVATMAVGTGCKQKSSESSMAAAVAADTIIRYTVGATRDTIIKHTAAGLHDTIIKHAAATPDSCKKIPRPPECPVEFLGLKIDTIIK